MIPTSYAEVMSNDNPILLANPNLLVHYYSKENLQRLLEFPGHLNLTDVGDNYESVFFALYIPEYGESSPHIFTAKSSAYDLWEAGFNPDRETIILVHGFSSSVEKFVPQFAKGKH